MDWQQILKRAKVERIPLQKQVDELIKKLHSLDLEIFTAKRHLKDKERRKKEE